MKITGSTRDGRFIQFDITLIDNISSARQIIDKREGIPKRRVVLMLDGQILKDKYTINHYRLDSVIFDIIILKPKPFFCCCGTSILH